MIGVNLKKEICVLYGINCLFYLTYIYLYISNKGDDMKNTKLTTVKIIKDVYAKFKQISFDSGITLQKVVNRSLHKYNTDEEYRNSINTYDGLHESGSQF